jgi:CRISPR-associated protein Csd1
VILQALVKLAEAEGLCRDLDFEYKPVAWLVRLRPDGTLINIESTYTDSPLVEGSKKKPKAVAKQCNVPRQAPSRSGTKAPAEFFVDNAKYVFGRSTPDKPFSEAEGAQKSGWFLELVRGCANATGDAGALAVVSFLERVRRGEYPEALRPETKSNDLFVFALGTGGDFVHLRPKVQEHWRRLRLSPAAEATELADSAHGDEPASRRCLITGQPVQHVGIFPKIDRVPGCATPGGVSLVGFNAPAFESHGWDGNDNAPFSRAAAEAAATALNRLLNPDCPNPGKADEKLPRRRLSLGGDTVLVYWAAGARAPETIDFFADAIIADPPDPERVADLYRSVWQGKPVAIDDPAMFYAMTLSGAQGRAVLRDWMETTVRDVYAHLADHFRDLLIVRNTPPAKGKPPSPAIPLPLLLNSLAAPGQSDVPAAMAADLVRAAIGGTPYPFAILQKALLRTRAESGGNEWIDSARRDARAALIKAVLNRRRRALPDAAARYQEITVNMDPNSTSTGYNLGALLAVLERLQTEALGDVNASVIDKYFTAASATPRAVFDRLLKGARHHARKAADENPQRVFGLERLLDELVGRVSPTSGGFPASLDLEQQGLFVIGYHHMRKFLWMSREERDAWEAEHADASKAFTRKKTAPSAESAV